MLTVANLSKHKNFALCLKIISVGYTTGCVGGGGVKICDVIFEGVQSIVTKCDEEERGVNFSLKLRDVIYGRPQGR